ncbi:hypothetical protein DVW12_10125 [Clostridium botulinum]|nr:hypothetical protein [Clostridium botulinum]
MEYISLAISVISMLAGVISAIIAVKSKNESKKILKEIKEINIDQGIHSNSDNVNVSGGNNGIVAGTIQGGVAHNGR